jgi:hypothetical protein
MGDQKTDISSGGGSEPGLFEKHEEISGRMILILGIFQSEMIEL